MKFLRFVVVLLVIAYAGWLAWPLISPLLDGAPFDATAMRADVDAGAGGNLFGVLPPWTLWAAAILLYVVAALMLGAGDMRAAVAYFLGFAADAALRLAIDRQGGGEAAARSAGPVPEAVSGLPVDPIWLVLGGLVLLGILVVVAARRIRRPRVAGQLAF